MQGLLGRLSAIVNSLLNLTGLAGLTDSLVALGLAIFALSLGFFAIQYLHKRRELLHQERMAALVKGLHYAGLANQVFNDRKVDTREHLLRGLRWLFGALGLSCAMYGSAELQHNPDMTEALQGALVGVLPASIGVAHLLYSWVGARQQRRAQAAVYRTGTYRPGMYRTGVRR